MGCGVALWNSGRGWTGGSEQSAPRPPKKCPGMLLHRTPLHCAAAPTNQPQRPAPRHSLAPQAAAAALRDQAKQERQQIRAKLSEWTEEEVRGQPTWELGLGGSNAR